MNFLFQKVGERFKEDITWLRGNTKFLLECWKIFLQHDKRECCICYINTNESPNHFTLIVFCRERRDLLCSHSNGHLFTCEDNMLFSHVKISCFRQKAHLVFHWCLYNKRRVTDCWTEASYSLWHELIEVLLLFLQRKVLFCLLSNKSRVPIPV